MATDLQQQVVQFVANNGARAVVVSGGEPTLLPSFADLLRSIRSVGLRCVVSTNGLNLERMLPAVGPLLDWLALPLEAADGVINNRMRQGATDGGLSTLSLLRIVRARHPHIRIKLGTVVTQLNIASVEAIPSVLATGPLPDVWKLYQMSPTSYGEDNFAYLGVTNDAFENVVRSSHSRARDLGLRIAVYRNQSRDGKYLFIDPDGDAKIIAAGRELVIGNVVSAPDRVLSAAVEHVDYEGCEANFRSTYT